MPTVTVDIDDELYELLMKLPAPEREEWSKRAMSSFAVAPNHPAVPIHKIDMAAMSGDEALARLDATFTAMDAIPDDENELSLEQLKANLNENRRLSGEEPIF